MKSRPTVIFFLLIQVLSPVLLTAQQLTATEIVRKTDEKLNGEMTGYSVMSMTIIRPTWQRTVEFRSWSREDDYALTLITAPAREKGQTFLKRKNEMWSWNPSINRLIKLPPSMMSQGWMGSDYTNDDILRESSVVEDYTHTIEGEEEIDGRMCYKIRLLAKEDAGVLWGRQLWWVDKKEFIALKAELFDEDGMLVRTEYGKELKTLDGRLLPTIIELIPAENPGNKTVLRIIELKFNIKLEESFFSQQNMKTVR
ncbi:MAG TPA: outer membrane lipoprotein-sorting protein [Bacteroidales bacterium]|jgi:outer membrane lipoprotein-sorting protein|nr:outer membrane lipoprotein-sorting protein [Bacteroidales bacterium]HBZ21978.1 outer membrane lipoprotein-sorting protein [Bacteroidales bacterium]